MAFPEHTSCQGWGPSILVDPDRLTLLSLTLGAPHPLLAHWGAVATYWVQLRAAPVGTCTSPPCYQALLLDAAPDALVEG
jgi:hypothetical protein